MRIRLLSDLPNLFKLSFLLSLSMLSPHSYSAQIVEVDLVVYGDYLVTMDNTQGESLTVIEHGAVAVSGTSIIALGKAEDIKQRFTAKRSIDGKNRILMPGLVNGHGHSPMVLFRGMADDLKLMQWLTNYIFPMEGKFVDAEFVEVGAKLACWEMIRGGTTSYVDMYFYPEVIAEVVNQCGIRAVIASPSIDFPSPGYKGWDDSFAAAVNFVETQQIKNERITPAFGPHAPYTVSAEHIAEVVAAAKRLDAPVSMHLAEAPAELIAIQEKYDDTPVQHVAKLGLLDTKIISAHMVYPNDIEIALLAEHQAGAIHNPTSNLKIAAGIAPVPKMLDAGISVGLGTDGAASNNDLDMWEEIHLAALIHKQENNDATVMPAYQVLEMATRLGAKAIHLGDQTGMLAPGYKADMIQIDIDSPGLTPMYNVISQLVYTVDSDDVTTSIVSGKVLMLDKQVLTLDGQAIRAEALTISDKIKQALKQSN